MVTQHTPPVGSGGLTPQHTLPSGLRGGRNILYHCCGFTRQQTFLLGREHDTTHTLLLVFLRDTTHYYSGSVIRHNALLQWVDSTTQCTLTVGRQCITTHSYSGSIIRHNALKVGQQYDTAHSYSGSTIRHNALLQWANSTTHRTLPVVFLQDTTHPYIESKIRHNTLFHGCFFTTEHTPPVASVKYTRNLELFKYPTQILDIVLDVQQNINMGSQGNKSLL